MRIFAILVLAACLAGAVSAQPQSDAGQTAESQPTIAASSQENHAGTHATEETLGPGDLISLVVYDSPELSRNFRVDEEGGLRLPMLRQHIQVAGLTMDECENAIAAALVNEQVLVNPIVSVSVTEFHSRPITVVGAVKSPSTFQASSSMTLLDALTRAGGMTDNAGSMILISHQSSSEHPGLAGLVERVPAKSLQDPASNSANIVLQGGDIVRIPQAGQVYMVGTVKHPGPFYITNNTDMTMMRALSIAGGLDAYASHTAYIYRSDKDDQHKTEIPVKLSKILARKAPDVPLYADDMVYIPNRTFAANGMKTLEVAGAALGIASFFVYTVR